LSGQLSIALPFGLGFALAVLLAVLFGCAMVTNRIGIFATFGAFFLGAVLSPEHALVRPAARLLWRQNYSPRQQLPRPRPGGPVGWPARSRP
jgi:hypothetical protein